MRTIKGLLATWIATMALAICLSGCERREDVYCPVTTLEAQGLGLYVYLKLDDDGRTECLEMRAVDHRTQHWFRNERVLLRAFGVEYLRMVYLDSAGRAFPEGTTKFGQWLESKSVLLKMYANTSDTIPALTTTLGDIRATQYYELRRL